jgi:hypothetical protein
LKGFPPPLLQLAWLRNGLQLCRSRRRFQRKREGQSCHRLVCRQGGSQVSQRGGAYSCVCGCVCVWLEIPKTATAVRGEWTPQTHFTYINSSVYHITAWLPDKPYDRLGHICVSSLQTAFIATHSHTHADVTFFVAERDAIEGIISAYACVSQRCRRRKCTVKTRFELRGQRTQPANHLRLVSQQR